MKRYLLPLIIASGVLISDGLAADDNLTALSPKPGATYDASAKPRPEFRVRLARVPGPRAGVSYQVFMRASTSKQIDGRLIGKDAFIGRMQQVNAPSGKVFRLTPDAQRRYLFRAYWLNHPDTYYWQAYYIQCVAQRGCIHAGPRNRIMIRR